MLGKRLRIYSLALHKIKCIIMNISNEFVSVFMKQDRLQTCHQYNQLFLLTFCLKSKFLRINLGQFLWII